MHMDIAHEHFQMNTNVDAFVASTTEIATTRSVVHTTADPATESSV